MTDRKMKKRIIIDIADGLTGSIDKAIQCLKSHKKDYPNAYIGYDYVGDGGYTLQLMHDTLETDVEYTNRIAEEKRYTERQNQFELTQYETLRKKFEPQQCSTCSGNV